ncbi:MAG: aspartyl/asparaginyl beta-hydroxylase domain-containing protein [Microthrixaceae bacterium]
MFRHLSEGSLISGFLDPAPLASMLEPFARRTDALRAEAVGLADEWIDHPDRHLASSGWSIVPPRYFGADDAEASAAAPVLAGLLSQAPEVLTAAYMRLAPGTVLEAHRGNPIGVARCHLGLVVPEGAWLEVAGERRRWAEGCWLVFDDTAIHRAANDSPTGRIVLSLDLEHPDVEVTRWARPVRWMSRRYYTAVRRHPRLEFALGRLAPISALLQRAQRTTTRLAQRALSWRSTSGGDRSTR